MRPVVEVNHDHGDREFSLDVLTRDAKDLLLTRIPQLALPETGVLVRQIRRWTSCRSVVLHDIPVGGGRGGGGGGGGRCACGGDPVVYLLCGLGGPRDGVGAKVNLQWGHGVGKVLGGCARV